MKEKEKRRSEIQQLDYSPRTPYRLDLEIFSVADLRRRGNQEKRFTHRYSFHMLVCVTEGTCTHLVDFKPIPCEPGTLLVLRPGQVHNFGFDEEWDGWIILFRPEFFLPSSASASDLKLRAGYEKLPEHLTLCQHGLQKFIDSLAQMNEDTGMDAPLDVIHALLRYQLYALLARLNIFHDRQEVQACTNTRAMQRFKDFKQLVEKNFTQWHQVADYAKPLGWTEKSLTRAAMEAAGVNAKAFIASRISLEAKRLLVHTNLSVTLIAESLGFEESTNFIKFFKREVGCTPVEFRRQQDAASIVYGST